MDQMDRIANVAQAIFDESVQQCIRALFVALVGAVILRAGTHYVCKINLRYWSAYKYTLLVLWVTAGCSAVFSMLAFAGSIAIFDTLTQEYIRYLTIVTMGLVLASGFLIASLLYGAWIKDADGAPIGRKKGFLVALVSTLIGIGVALGIATFIGLAVFFMGK